MNPGPIYCVTCGIYALRLKVIDTFESHTFTGASYSIYFKIQAINPQNTRKGYLTLTMKCNIHSALGTWGEATLHSSGPCELQLCINFFSLSNVVSIIWSIENFITMYKIYGITRIEMLQHTVCPMPDGQTRSPCSWGAGYTVSSIMLSCISSRAPAGQKRQ